jgi:hypothetical protein
MTRLFYAVDHNVDNRATVSGIVTFDTKKARDEFVAKKPQGYVISAKDADTACRKTYERTARDAQQWGFI